MHFCGHGEGIRICPSGYPLGGAPGLWVTESVSMGYSKWSEHLVHITSSKSDSPPVRLGHHQGLLMLEFLFITFVEIIFRNRQGAHWNLDQDHISVFRG